MVLQILVDLNTHVHVHVPVVVYRTCSQKYTGVHDVQM